MTDEKPIDEYYAGLIRELAFWLQGYLQGHGPSPFESHHVTALANAEMLLLERAERDS